MYEEIFIAGSGGQGVLSLGKILVYCSVEENKYATYYPSYGAEVRGGTANCMVKISSNFIYSPVVESPTITVIMNTPSYIKFIKKFAPRKFLFLNSSLVKEQKEIENFLKQKFPSLEIVRLSATEIANNIGSTIVSNIIMLAGIIKKTKILEKDHIKSIFSKIFNQKLLNINIKAFEVGLNIL